MPRCGGPGVGGCNSAAAHYVSTAIERYVNGWKTKHSLDTMQQPLGTMRVSSVPFKTLNSTSFLVGFNLSLQGRSL
jgi:hypothetical protein